MRHFGLMDHKGFVLEHVTTNIGENRGNRKMPRRFKGSTSVDLDKVEEVAMVNPKNAILMLVTYLKIKERKIKK